MAALLLLPGCIIQTAPPVKPETGTAPAHTLPAPIVPDTCVADWYAKATLPPCVEAWITDITKQQKAIKAKAKKKPVKPHRALPTAPVPVITPH